MTLSVFIIYFLFSHEKKIIYSLQNILGWTRAQLHVDLNKMQSKNIQCWRWNFHLKVLIINAAIKLLAFVAAYSVNYKTIQKWKMKIPFLTSEQCNLE